MENIQAKGTQQQNTIQILITNSPSTACTKSYKQLYEQHQQNSRISLIRWFDTFILKLLNLIRTIWNILPKAIRGSSNQSQIFCTYIKTMKFNIPNNLTLSSDDFETTLKKNQFSVMLAYTCNEHIKRDIKKLLKNQKVQEFSKKYPLCPLNNYSNYFKQYIRPNLSKTYSVYLIVFGINLLSEVVMLDIYKPIDEEIVQKIQTTIARFKQEQTQRLKQPIEFKNQITPKQRERHFSIPKVLELEDLSFPDDTEKEEENKSQVIEED